MARPIKMTKINNLQGKKLLAVMDQFPDIDGDTFLIGENCPKCETGSAQRVYVQVNDFKCGDCGFEYITEKRMS